MADILKSFLRKRPLEQSTEEDEAPLPILLAMNNHKYYRNQQKLGKKQPKAEEYLHNLNTLSRM